MADDGRMTLIEHLSELRNRIIRSGIAVVVGMVVCFALSEHILTLLMRPLLPLGQQGLAAQEPLEEGAEAAATVEAGQGVELIFTNPLEPFLLYLKIAAFGGIVLSLPYIVYQLCMFVFPGLTPKERRAATILVVGSSVLVIAGTAMAYFGVFPFVLPYLMAYAPEWAVGRLSMRDTLNIMVKGMLGFAVAFQFPMVVLVLVYLELLDPATLRRHRKVAIVGIAFVSAFLTPPDPLTMAMMGLPLWLLFEISILLGALVVRKRKQTA